MTTIYDVPADKAINLISKEFKDSGKMSPPSWSAYVKTGANKEKSPENSDWWFLKCASIFRKIHIIGPIGIPRLRRIYGGKKNRGYKPEGVSGASGSIIRDILQQLEKIGLIKKTKVGRITTPKGVSLLDSLSHKIRRDIPALKKY
jgi:small subunit ribosomal protein S19e|tara:strand:+ start:448 stop:885 length:438 start_codon:yes stop_codon:yes gene_type:complete